MTRPEQQERSATAAATSGPSGSAPKGSSNPASSRAAFWKSPLASGIVPLPAEHVDTDQILPARFLKTTVREGLGRFLFHDWRYDDEGQPKPEFVLNQAPYKGAQILLAGHNFGCGSSREHAPWALVDHGFRAVISTAFADIFRANSLKNGLLPVVVAPDLHRRLMAQATAGEPVSAQVDLEQLQLTLPDGESVSFKVDAFARHCLLEGVDEMGYLLAQLPAIAQWEAQRDSVPDTRTLLGGAGEGAES